MARRLSECDRERLLLIDWYIQKRNAHQSLPFLSSLPTADLFNLAHDIDRMIRRQPRTMAGKRGRFVLGCALGLIAEAIKAITKEAAGEGQG